ncbi:hypothetical protein P3L51_16985 [Streptomyces sp. PSRA5]|uniref:hypothetical protein n=1 Tax=Streptomyces panacea TaxID=3035064 RepID=UPI00339C17C0
MGTKKFDARQHSTRGIEERLMIDETPPGVGGPVLDISVGRLAEFRGPVGELWLLRSYLGTYEWEGRPEDVRRAEEAQTPGSAAPSEAHTECEECDAWWWAEQLALDDDELSEAVDCRIYLGRHQNTTHGGAPPTASPGSAGPSGD